jgi:hypothetical protein
MKEKEKGSWIFYQSWEKSIHLLTLEERGQLLSNLIAYHNGEEILLNTPMLTIFWNSIEYNLDRNAKRYKSQCDNGSLGGAPKGNTNAKKDKTLADKYNELTNNQQSTQLQPKVNLNDNDNKNENGNDNYNMNDNEYYNDDENKNGNVNGNVNKDDTEKKFREAFPEFNEVK